MTTRYPARRTRGLRSLASALALAAATLPATLQALPTDRDQPMYIQSDRAERDERKGLTVYAGEVEVDQGSLHMSADRVTIAMDGDTLTQVVASGKPVKVRQKPEQDAEPVYLNAGQIEYNAVAEVLTLTGKASVTQDGGGLVTGETIVYYIREQRVKASAGDAAAGSGRVRTVLPPRRANGTEAGNGAAPAAPAATPAPAAAAAPATQGDTSHGAP